MQNSVLFCLFNLKSFGELKKTYKEVQKINLSHTFNDKALRCYLKTWGFDENILNNPLMTKQDIIEWRIKTKADKKAYTFSYTGGSTGEPLKMPISKKRDIIRKATILFYNSLAGYTLGRKYLFIRVSDRPWWQKKIRNEFIFIPRNIDKEEIYQLIKVIQKNKIEFIIGYPSVIYELAVSALENKSKVSSIKGIIASSEPLYPHQSEAIQAAFNCIILDRYSNEEVGVIAHQREAGGDLIVDHYGVFVEVVDPITLQPIPAGKEGLVVVTDINSDLIPIIRYNTGDRAIVSKRDNDMLYSLNKVLGRQTEEILSTKGSVILSQALSPSIHKPFSEHGLLCNYQFAQVGKVNYELRIKPPDKPPASLVLNKVKHNLSLILGSDAQITIVYTNNFNVRKSGKVPVYVNEFHK